MEDPSSNGRISVTIASSNTLTLALPIQNHTKTPSSSSSDCWTDAATAVLIDAWGERYLELSRGNLKHNHWKHVAQLVNTRQPYPKTDIQCKNRIDTVKKKYKAEKAKIGGAPSTWPFYHKLDQLLGPSAKLNSPAPPAVDVDATNNMVYQRLFLPMGIPVGVGSSSSAKRPMGHSDDESEPENSDDSSDGLPPESSSSYKRPKIERETVVANNNASASRHGMMNKKSDGGDGGRNKESSSSNWGNSMREVSRAIFRFGEAYEQVETVKLQQLVEMEKQRMKFAKELELQRMQYFMKIQLELSQFKTRRPGNNNNNNHHGMDNNNDTNNNNNNSDSSN